MVMMKWKKSCAWCGGYIGAEKGSWDPEEAVVGAVAW